MQFLNCIFLIALLICWDYKGPVWYRHPLVPADLVIHRLFARPPHPLTFLTALEALCLRVLFADPGKGVGLGCGC